MFQYAAAKSLSTRLNKPFKLETITSLQKDKGRTLALQDLETHFELATKKEVGEFAYFPSLYRHPVGLFKRGKNVYREKQFHFDPGFFSLKDPVFIDGYWQSPLYFKDIEETIRLDFTPKPELIKNVIDIAKEMQSKPSVAVHIRRGDFLKRKIKAYHGVMSAFYFEKAIGIIKERIPSAYLYFFSDDINWVKQNLVVNKNAEFVSAYTHSAIEDFYLMSQCRHNVIANSSFSWWAAWLNANPDKIVVGPLKWFSSGGINTTDLMPNTWLRI
jgi:hypothetical protein